MVNKAILTAIVVFGLCFLMYALGQVNQVQDQLFNQFKQSLRHSHLPASTGRDCAIVYGTRPELIKMVPLIRRLREQTDLCNLVIVSSGQHKELLLPLEEYFRISPDVDLRLMQVGGELATLASRALTEFTTLWKALKPVMVFVQGDTTTALMAGAAAFHLDVHVLHVEAGLRTGDLSSPFPEEFNRQTLGLVCTLCFAPTEMAATALSRESVHASRVVMTGNTVVDSLQYSLQHPPLTVAAAGGVVLTALDGPQGRNMQLLVAEETQSLLRGGKHVVLLTAHRRENARDGGFAALGQAVAALAKRHPTVQWLFALHFNPAVREVILPLLSNLDNVWLVSPPAYPEFVQLLCRVTLIVSDSGGLQEEGLALGLPTLITRSNTERMEGVLAGGARLVGNRRHGVEAAVDELLSSKDVYAKMAAAPSPYGNGTAAVQILDSVRAWNQGQASTNSASVAAASLIRASHGAEASSPPGAKPGGGAAAPPPARKATPTPVINHPVTPQHAFHYRKNELTVVLTGYQRPAALLERQLAALERSTLKPAKVVFFQNGNYVNFSAVLTKWPNVRHIHARTWNTKFHGRFAAALLLDTEYVAIADDTNVPGPKWLEAAVQAANSSDGIIGNSGRNVVVDKFFSNPRMAYQTGRDSRINGHKTPELVQVDFVGHWWVCRTYHMRAMWSFQAATLWTAEDIHLSAAAMIVNGAKSYVLDVPNAVYQPEENVNNMLTQDKPSYKVPGTDDERAYAVQYWLEQGWQPLSMLKHAGKTK